MALLHAALVATADAGRSGAACCRNLRFAFNLDAACFGATAQSAFAAGADTRTARAALGVHRASADGDAAARLHLSTLAQADAGSPGATLCRHVALARNRYAPADGVPRRLNDAAENRRVGDASRSYARCCRSASCGHGRTVDGDVSTAA